MQDVTTEIRRTRRRHKLYYHCSICNKNLVSKKGGRCRLCGVKAREENYRKLGIKHPGNRTFTRVNHSAKSHKHQNHNCAAHWMIGDKLLARCSKCDIKTKALLCGDSNLPCPYDGVRDFAALQAKLAHRYEFLESCTKGGEKAGKLRGGKRGRPRKIREVI